MVDVARNKLKILKIVLWSILGAILLFVLIAVGTLLVRKYIKKDPVPMFAKYASLIVITGSMNGTIDKGDMIIIKRTEDYAPGDIVTYIEDSGAVITHRLVNYGSEEGTFIAKGDANNTPDDPIREDQIVGEVVHIIPKVGAVVDWFISGGGIIYTIAIIAVIVAGVYFWNLLKPEPEAEAENPVPDAGGDSPAEAVTDKPEDVPQLKEENMQDSNEQ